MLALAQQLAASETAAISDLGEPAEFGVSGAETVGIAAGAGLSSDEMASLLAGLAAAEKIQESGVPEPAAAAAAAGQTGQTGTDAAAKPRRPKRSKSTKPAPPALGDAALGMAPRGETPSNVATLPNPACFSLVFSISLSLSRTPPPTLNPKP